MGCVHVHDHTGEKKIMTVCKKAVTLLPLMWLLQRCRPVSDHLQRVIVFGA